MLVSNFFAIESSVSPASIVQVVGLSVATEVVSAGAATGAGVATGAAAGAGVAGAALEVDVSAICADERRAGVATEKDRAQMSVDDVRYSIGRRIVELLRF
jgi:hypothetical protein